ncbi:MAG: metallophosphoesterase [Bacilli bacterium]
MSIVLFIITSLYIISNYYVANKILKTVLFPFNINKTIYFGLFTLVAMSYLLTSLPIKVLKNIFNIIGSFWIGLLLYLLMFFLIVDGILLLLKLGKVINQSTSKKIQFITSIIVLVSTIFLFSYGLYNACQVQTKDYDIVLKTKDINEDIKLVLVSDFHLGSPLSLNRLDKIVDIINYQEPDIVCIVGDLFDNDFDTIVNPDKVKELLSSIKSKYGVYATLGNHDSGSTYNKMMELVKNSNINILKDEYVNIEDKFILVGRIDERPIGGFDGLKRKSTEEVLNNIATNLPIIVMDHNPSKCQEYENKADLVLSGHTHKGQVFPANLITDKMFLIDYGYLKLSNTNIVVTSGVGTWKLPLRIGSNNEVVNITISS